MESFDVSSSSSYVSPSTGKVGSVDPAAATSTMNALSDGFVELKTLLQRGWKELDETIVNEWQGIAGDDFRKALAEKLFLITNTAWNITTQTIGYIELATNYVLENEQSRVFEGRSIAELTKVIAPATPEIKESDLEVIGETKEFIGLKAQADGVVHAETNKQNIEHKLVSVVQSIEDKYNEIYDNAKIKGENVITLPSIKEKFNDMLASAGKLSGSVGTALQDFRNALEPLITQRTSELDSKLSNELDQVAADMKNAQVGESRWNMTK